MQFICKLYNNLSELSLQGTQIRHTVYNIYIWGGGGGGGVVCTDDVFSIFSFSTGPIYQKQLTN